MFSKHQVCCQRDSGLFFFFIRILIYLSLIEQYQWHEEYCNTFWNSILEPHQEATQIHAKEYTIGLGFLKMCFQKCLFEMLDFLTLKRALF